MTEQFDRTTGEVYAPQLGALTAALAKAQSVIVNPPRNREVEVKSEKGRYTFRYATLDAIIDTIRKPLTDNGLWFTQTLEDQGGRYVLRTTLLHESGQSISSLTPILVEGGKSQAFGSALSYMRRYALTAMLGIAADEDDDGNAADGNSATGKDRQTKPQQRTAPKTKEDAFGLKSIAPVSIVVPNYGPDPKRGWTEWCQEFRMRASFATLDEIDGWLRQNQPQLDGLQAYNAKWHAKLMADVEEFRAKLEQQMAEMAEAAE